jgi:hypothetical protein
MHLTWLIFVKLVEVSYIEESCFFFPICYALTRGQFHHEKFLRALKPQPVLRSYAFQAF